MKKKIKNVVDIIGYTPTVNVFMFDILSWLKTIISRYWKVSRYLKSQSNKKRISIYSTNVMYNHNTIWWLTFSQYGNEKIQKYLRITKRSLHCGILIKWDVYCELLNSTNKFERLFANFLKSFKNRKIHNTNNNYYHYFEFRCDLKGVYVGTNGKLILKKFLTSNIVTTAMMEVFSSRKINLKTLKK